eukprot:5481840-Alexandrium_andersonii.AAC.1
MPPTARLRQEISSIWRREAKQHRADVTAGIKAELETWAARGCVSWKKQPEARNGADVTRARKGKHERGAWSAEGKPR